MKLMCKKNPDGIFEEINLKEAFKKSHEMQDYQFRVLHWNDISTDIDYVRIDWAGHDENKEIIVLGIDYKYDPRPRRKTENKRRAATARKVLRQHIKHAVGRIPKSLYLPIPEYLVLGKEAFYI